MRNHKKLIGIFRVSVYLIALLVFDFEFSVTGLKFWVSDIIHGAHTAELRNSLSVNSVMFIILAIASYYIIQTLFYIFVGNDLNGKNTGLLRFLKYFIAGIRQNMTDPNFWSNNASGDLSNIERVVNYRDNKTAFMSNKEASEYMKGTGHVDMMMSRPDLKQSRKTLSYLNGKMAFMDNETAINFLKNNK